MTVELSDSEYEVGENSRSVSVGGSCHPCRHDVTRAVANPSPIDLGGRKGEKCVLCFIKSWCACAARELRAIVCSCVCYCYMYICSMCMQINASIIMTIFLG